MGDIFGLIGDLFQGTTNLTSQLLTNRSNRKNVFKTNQANKDIAMMNNEYNEQMLQKQMDYNTEMWNKQNEYNSPRKQVERLRSAGINPHFTLGQVASGQGSSQPLPINTPTATPYQAQAFQAEAPRLSGMAEGLHQYVSEFLSPQADVNRQTAEGLRQENEVKSQMLMAKIKDYLASAKDKESKSYYTNTLSRLNDATFSDDVLLKNRQAQAWRLDVVHKSFQNQLAAKELQSYDERLKSQLALNSSQILVNDSIIGQNVQNTRESLARTIQTNIRSYGYKIDNYKAKKMADSMIKQEALRLTHMEYDSVKKAWDAVKAWQNSGPDNLYQGAGRLGRSLHESFNRKDYKFKYGLPLPSM